MAKLDNSLHIEGVVPRPLPPWLDKVHAEYDFSGSFLEMEIQDFTEMNMIRVAFHDDGSQNFVISIIKQIDTGGQVWIKSKCINFLKSVVNN